MSDLVQRLRKQANMTNLPTTWGEAADRIESLEQCLLQAQNASIDLAKQLAEARGDAKRYEYVLHCDYRAAKLYLKNLDEAEHKAKIRAKHDRAIAAMKDDGAEGGV